MPSCFVIQPFDNTIIAVWMRVAAAPTVHN
jgi:hypothetical protein